MARTNSFVWAGRTALTLALAILFWQRWPAIAQDSPSTSASKHTRTVSKRLSLDERVKRFASALDLDEAQQSAVKGILQRRYEKVSMIVSNRSISGSDRISMLRALGESTITQIRSVLNDEQKKKYDPLGYRAEKQAPEMSVDDWLKVTTPK